MSGIRRNGGSGSTRRKQERSDAWMLVGAGVTLMALTLAFAAYALTQGFLARQGLRPDLNSQTRLADGVYSLEVTSSYHLGDECWYRGTVTAGDSIPAGVVEIAVYGQGVRRCGAENETYGTVTFSVDRGFASITHLGRFQLR